MEMSSGEERLEEMLKAVMGTEGAAGAGGDDDWDIPGIDLDDEAFLSDIPEMPEIPGMEDDFPEDDFSGEMPEIPELEDEMPGDMPEISGLEDGFSTAVPDRKDEIPEIPETADDISEKMPEISGLEDELSEKSIEDSRMSEDLPEIPKGGNERQAGPSGDAAEAAGDKRKSADDEMMVDPLALLDMSEEEIDKVLEKEAGGGRASAENRETAKQDDRDLADLLGENDELSDIQNLLAMSDNHELVAEESAQGDFSFGEVDLDSESVQSMLGLNPDDAFEEEQENEAPAEKKQEKKPKEKKAKNEKKPSKEGGEKKEGFGKKLARLFFGSDEDELDSEESGEKAGDAKDGAADKGKKEDAKAGKQEKKKKEKKKKPDKKKEPDPQKAAKEKLKKAKNAEKAKKKAEKAEQAEKERRAAKKLPKKKVIVWVVFCASIGAGILLMNSVGMSTLQLTEARNAYYDKDFETAYELLNGGELSEEDQVIFQQSSAVLHLNHAEEAYENHLKMEKPVMALEDLLKGVGKYQGLLSAGQNSLITPELTAQYQNILSILQDKYNLSEAGAMEINALDDDYEFSLRLEAIVNGETYQSQSEIAQQEEEAAAAYPELEDILPEEEEYLEEYMNDSDN